MDLKQTQENWNALGSSDPLFGVLSHEGKRGGGWNEAEFFATGVAEIGELFRRAKELGLDFAGGRALDFGCAVGRLSQALAPHFQEVDGVDIAPSMLEQARRYNRFGERCRYILNDKPDLGLFPDSAFDLIYSNIVLQHMAPTYALNYIAEFVRVLSPQGLLVFQVPPGPQYGRIRLGLKALTPKPLLRLYRRWRYGAGAEGAAEIEMNGVSPRRVAEVLDRAGGELKHAGQGWYWVKKRK
jgi:SAM-dependent methyltransferase